MAEEAIEAFLDADDPQSAERRDAISKALQERREKVLEERERKVETRRETSLAQEGVLKEIEVLLAAARAELDAARASDARGVALAEALDGANARLAAAERFVSEQARAVPPYDQRRVQAALGAIREDMAAAQDELQPKKKFGFKGNKKSKKAAAAPAATAAAEEKKETGKVIEDIGLTVRDKRDETVVISRADTHQKDVLLSDLRGCTVHVLGSPSTLHATGLVDCTLVCGPVSPSVFVDDSSACVFVLAGCQQLRTHRTTSSAFHLHVTSKAIVEDCSGVEFAPVDLDYPGLETDFSVSGLDGKVNNWDKVDDFNWLASDEPSPNWSVMDQGKRKKFVI